MHVACDGPLREWDTVFAAIFDYPHWVFSVLFPFLIHYMAASYMPLRFSDHSPYDLSRSRSLSMLSTILFFLYISCVSSFGRK